MHGVQYNTACHKSHPHATKCYVWVYGQLVGVYGKEFLIAEPLSLDREQIDLIKSLSVRHLNKYHAGVSSLSVALFI